MAHEDLLGNARIEGPGISFGSTFGPIFKPLEGHFQKYIWKNRNVCELLRIDCSQDVTGNSLSQAILPFHLPPLVISW